MVIYILDALQHREAALLAVWLCLGLMNMSFALTAFFFTDNGTILTSVFTAIMNGITLFLTGTRVTLHLPKASKQPHRQQNIVYQESRHNLMIL